MTGTVYDSSGVSYIVPTPIISLVFFRGKTFIPPIPAIPANLVFLDVGSTLNLTWEVSQYATSYTVNFYRNTVNNLTTGSIYETVTTSATSVTSTMSTSTIYFYYATIFSSNFARDSATVKTEYAISYSSGAVTIAGKPGVTGTTNGFGEENRYFIPLFGSIDPAGNLYITSGYAYIIQRLTIPGYQGSTFSTSANITHPRGSVVYNGYLYVCDGGPSLPLGSIKKMPLSGGTATTLASGLTNPVYIAIDGAGGFYVSTQQYDIIYRISSGGTVSQRNISGYNGITGIAYHPPTGYIYFTNTATGSTTSSFARVAEGSSSAELIQGNIDFSVGVKMNHDNTAVYYSVTNDNTIRKYVIATGSIIAIIGSVNDNSYVDSLTLANVRINNCYDIIVMNDGLGMYVLDQGPAAQTVRKVIFGDEPPPAPTNVQLVYTIGDPTMTVTYVAVTGATSYTGQFYLNTTETTTGATSVQGPTTLATTSFTSTFTIVRNRYYYAVVKSFNAIGSSSNRTGFTYSGLDSPTGVAMGAYTSGATSISVSWTSVEGATSYTVRFYASGNATPVQTFTSVTSLTQASTFTLVANTTYYASVSANNSIGSSAFQDSSNNITTVAAENTIIFTTEGTAAVNTSSSGFYITSTPNKSTVSLEETLTFTAFNIPYQPGSPYAWFLNVISGGSIASNRNPITYNFTSMGNHTIVANVNSFPINGRSINTSVNSLAFTVISLYNNSKTFETHGNMTINLTNANSTPIWINVINNQASVRVTINSTEFTTQNQPGSSIFKISIYISNPSTINSITITNPWNDGGIRVTTVSITNSSQYSSTATY